MLDLAPIAPTDPSAASPRPGALRHAIVRSGFCYWMLFCIPVLTTQVDSLEWSGKLVGPLWKAMVVWVGQHVLAISGPIHTADNGSGDKAADWILLLCIAALALIAALTWTVVGRNRPSDARLRELLHVVLRYTLAFVMLGYGIAKLFVGQFSPPSANRLVEQYGDSSPMGLMWTFMGASPAYQFFSGAMETVGALLLLFRRTATLGALVLAVVLTNVVMMNFCFDVPVKINSSHYLAMCVVLIAPDLRRLLDVLVFHRPTQPALHALVLPRRWMRMARRVVKYGAIAAVLFVIAKAGIDSLRTKESTAWYEGYWNIAAFTRDGQDVPAIVSDATRWKRIRFQVAGTRHLVRWRFMDDSIGGLYTFAFDERAGTIALDPDPEDRGEPPRPPTGPLAMTYVRPDADHLQLEGKVGAESLRVRLERFHPDKMLLVSRGFHWINEVPFNR